MLRLPATEILLFALKLHGSSILLCNEPVLAHRAFRLFRFRLNGRVYYTSINHRIEAQVAAVKNASLDEVTVLAKTEILVSRAN